MSSPSLCNVAIACPVSPCQTHMINAATYIYLRTLLGTLACYNPVF